MHVSFPPERPTMFGAPRALAFEVDDDSLALKIRRGDWVVVEPQSKINCDSPYMLKTGEIVAIQCRTNDQVRILKADGSEEFRSYAEVEVELAGRILNVTRPVQMIDSCDLQMRSRVPQ